MYGPFWITISDHRPIYGCFKGPGLHRYSRMKHSPTKMPVMLKRIALSNFKDSKVKFKLAMTEMLHTIPGHTGAREAGDVLQTISRKTVEAVPGKPDKNLRRKTFKDMAGRTGSGPGHQTNHIGMAGAVWQTQMERQYHTA